MDAKMWIVYWTAPNKEAAKAIVSQLLEARAISCATMVAVESMYPWEGTVVDDKEIVVITKTIADQVDTVKDFVAKRHSYQVPCILAWPVTAHEPYQIWAESVIKKN